MRKKNKMIAVFEVEFDANLMIDDNTLRTMYKGSMLKCMRFLFGEDGIGIFDGPFKLVKVRKIK
jgi:hypothetical protein